MVGGGGDSDGGGDGKSRGRGGDGEVWIGRDMARGQEREDGQGRKQGRMNVWGVGDRLGRDGQEGRNLARGAGMPDWDGRAMTRWKWRIVEAGAWNGMDVARRRCKKNSHGGESGSERMVGKGGEETETGGGQYHGRWGGKSRGGRGGRSAGEEGWSEVGETVTGAETGESRDRGGEGEVWIGRDMARGQERADGQDRERGRMNREKGERSGSCYELGLEVACRMSSESLFCEHGMEVACRMSSTLLCCRGRICQCLQSKAFVALPHRVSLLIRGPKGSRRADKLHVLALALSSIVVRSSLRPFGWITSQRILTLVTELPLPLVAPVFVLPSCSVSSPPQSRLWLTPSSCRPYVTPAHGPPSPSLNPSTFLRGNPLCAVAGTIVVASLSRCVREAAPSRPVLRNGLSVEAGAEVSGGGGELAGECQGRSGRGIPRGGGRRRGGDRPAEAEPRWPPSEEEVGGGREEMVGGGGGEVGEGGEDMAGGGGGEVGGGGGEVGTGRRRGGRRRRGDCGRWRRGDCGRWRRGDGWRRWKGGGRRRKVGAGGGVEVGRWEGPWTSVQGKRRPATGPISNGRADPGRPQSYQPDGLDFRVILRL
ncbi:hypothetical protein CBR_g3121 [Chara braunii]|uniref:Uncharacterized protein n=1 Tax=Chara braunii TaxID=69332 RepID=A0A388KEZ7_CHABU|nr:hypothetical protein CBR_g3121 [Chara braunii]|eukprot:GBG68576.1 hypothetical protein CBR_g3121 [Chara braunii]